MIDRSLFTLGAGNPDYPVMLSETVSVPTEQMSSFLADLLSQTGKVLEIGTGSGYQTAILAERCKEVVSIEAAPVRDLQEILHENVTLIHQDGTTYNTGETFDGILVTFGAKEIAPVWVTQLREGGTLVVPLQCGGSCKICVYHKKNGMLEFETIAAYAPFTQQVEVRDGYLSSVEGA